MIIREPIYVDSLESEKKHVIARQKLVIAIPKRNTAKKNATMSSFGTRFFNTNAIVVTREAMTVNTDCDTKKLSP